MENLSFEERAAASAVAALGGKRERDDSPDAAGGFKVARTDGAEGATAGTGGGLTMGGLDEAQAEEVALAPAPYFYYRDFSKEIDPDPLTPLTPPGRVPNFPAKMHAILSRPDLADVVCWMPHGRSWRVLKPREFEIRVIPTYFEHAKFSSFIRQANGWGFRRVTQGRDRNSYYHELFLRGLPHLCKQMKRPGVSEKQAADPDHEPDFYRIAEERQLPEKAEDDSILLQCTVQGGPKARMPIYTGVLGSIPSLLDTKIPASSDVKLTPRDQEALNAFQQALGASENQLKNLHVSTAPAPSPQPVSLPPSMFATMPASFSLPMNFLPGPNKMSTLAAANQLAFPDPNLAAAFQANVSQFAVGFAAATALSQQHFRAMLHLASQMPQGSDGDQSPQNAATLPNSSLGQC